MKMDRFNNASQYSTPGEKKQNETETNLLQRLSSYMYNGSIWSWSYRPHAQRLF